LMTSEMSIKIKYDNDLVQLAGYYAYIAHKKTDKLLVNGSRYDVVDTKYNDPSGLDAMTVKNTATLEYIIVFTGTADKKDVLTDVQLLSKFIPAQIQAAEDYYDAMSAKYKKISYVCGNSLGGATTNAVAIKHPEVKAVTLDPAILPDGMVDPKKSYSNITNYFSIYDVLTMTETTLGLGNRIPGRHVQINNGIPQFSKLATNHTGYLSEKDGQQYYTIGKKGQPGYGVIYVNADSQIMTNIWTGQPLYGGRQKIEINEDNLRILAHSLESDVHQQLSRAGEYLKHSYEIVENEAKKFRTRVHKLQMAFTDIFEYEAGNPIFKGITSTGNRFKSQLDLLRSFLNDAESCCQSLDGILNSPPMEIVEQISHVNIDALHLFERAKGYINQIEKLIDELTNGFSYIIHEKIPELFKGGTDLFYDAVVGEMEAHYQIINRNYKKVSEQLVEFKQQVQDVAVTFANRDQALANAITLKPGFTQEAGSIQKTNHYSLEPSKYMPLNMRIKQMKLDIEFKSLQKVLQGMTFPLLETIRGTLAMVEFVLETASSMIKNVTGTIGIYGKLTLALLNLFTDYENRIRELARQTITPLDEAAETVRGVKNGVDRLIARFPGLIDSLRPYIDSALFDQDDYLNIHLYNTAAINILKDMETLFKDIVFQLSNEKGLAIDALCQVSKDLLNNMSILEQQVQRVTLT